jgi:hypothetical protein
MWDDVVLVLLLFHVTSRVEGTVLVVRPDLLVEISAWIEDSAAFHKYPGPFLLQPTTTFCP